MGFSWNGIPTSDLGILAEARTLPILPEPKIVTEEIPGRDGFYDFSTFNADGRVHYKPREWEYRCSFDTALIHDVSARVAAVTKLFSSYSGYLIDDECPSVRWQGIVTNKFDLTQVARTLHTFSLTIRTQPFSEGLEAETAAYTVTGSGVISIVNPGTWYVRPEVYLTGTASGVCLGDMPVPWSGTLTEQQADGLVLSPGENIISVTGFTGAVRFDYTPLYIWGLSDEDVPDEPTEPEVPDFSFVIYGDSYTLNYLSGEALNFMIDWGDGTTSNVDSTDASQRTHAYASTDEWTIIIKNYVSGWLTFKDDSKLRRVLAAFPTSSLRTSFDNCFYNCKGLTVLPENLFANNSAATSFVTCFRNCTNLTSMPKDIFANNSAVTSFSYCFAGCIGLTSMPEDIFANNPAVASFDNCFNSCTNLTSVPGGLFAGNPLVTSFSYCFAGCNKLTTLPGGLFANNPAVTTFSCCFQTCTSLTAIPENLFANNPEVTSFYCCFNYCQKMSFINIKLHPDVLAHDTNYNAMFYLLYTSNSHTGLAPELWNSATTTASYKTVCFTNNTALTNYASIPTAWR